MMRRLLASLLALPLVASCSLGTFDALVPKDGGARLAAREAYAPGKRGGLNIYVPTRVAANDRLPVIVFFYGGSWNTGSKDDYGFAGRALASRGFVTVIPDYRLVPGTPYPGFLEDSAAAVKWVRANAARFGGDPDRIVLAGHSAGGYNAAMLALDPQWLGADRAAVKGFATMAAPFEFLPLDTQVTKDTFGAVADLATTQPVNFVTADDPPALLIGGGKDEIVFASQATSMAIRMSEAGTKGEARVYPELGHVGVMAALSTLLRGRAPVLDEIDSFAHRVTAAN